MNTQGVDKVSRALLGNHLSLSSGRGTKHLEVLRAIYFGSCEAIKRFKAEGFLNNLCMAIL